MNKQELDERIEQIEKFTMSPQVGKVVKQLIRDCIEAVTPGRSPKPPENIREHSFMLERNWVLDHIEANTKELLGDKQS